MKIDLCGLTNWVTRYEQLIWGQTNIYTRKRKGQKVHTSDITVSIHCSSPLWAAASTTETADPISSQADGWAPSTGSKSRDIVFEKYYRGNKEIQAWFIDFICKKPRLQLYGKLLAQITCWRIATLLVQRCTAIMKDLKLLSPAEAATSCCKYLKFR